MLSLYRFENDLIERSFFYEYEDLYEEPDYNSTYRERNQKKEQPRKEQKNQNFYIMM